MQLNFSLQGFGPGQYLSRDNWALKKFYERTNERTNEREVSVLAELWLTVYVMYRIVTGHHYSQSVVFLSFITTKQYPASHNYNQQVQIVVTEGYEEPTRHSKSLMQQNVNTKT